MSDTIRDLIGEAAIKLDDRGHNAADFGNIVLEALEAAGYVICRMPGGIHSGSCPTCGCQPQPSERLLSTS